MKLLSVFALVLISCQAFGQNVEVKGKVKKGTCATVLLHNFSKEQVPYTVFLYHNGVKGELIDESNMQHLVRVSIPKETKTGKGYQLGIVSGDQTFLSNTFTVKRKYALALYAIPVAAAVIYLAVDHQNDGDGETRVLPPAVPN